MPAGGKAPEQHHDWDALFAGLDDDAAAANSQTPTAGASAHTLPGGDHTTAAAAGSTTTTATAAEGNGSANAGASAGSAKEENSQARPVPGRALTEGGEHDDPILKNLTGMGYARKDALAALEKYDYNLERVSAGF